MVVEHEFRTSPTRSDTNPKRVKDGTQSLEDYLDPAATIQYLEFTHEQYKKAVGDEFGKTIMGFRGDEPDYSISGLPWTPKFFDRFTKIKGYNIRPYLAAFLQPRGAKLTDHQLRAKADYYDVFSQMFRDGFFKPQGDWCAANHLEYQVHLNHEEMEMDLTRSEGEFLRDMQYVQVPGSIRSGTRYGRIRSPIFRGLQPPLRTCTGIREPSPRASRRIGLNRMSIWRATF